MEQRIFTIMNNRCIAPQVYQMNLRGDISAITAPGQFVNIQLAGKFLRRPISVCNVNRDVLTLIYKVVGTGTEQMSKMTEGEKLDVLVGLGNGYNLEKSGERPLLMGGGVGAPPLYYLAKQLVAQGKEVTAILGFNKAEEVFLEKEFAAMGVNVIIATADGSRGVKGFVTDGVAKAGDYTYVYTCGPEPMLKAVYAKTTTGGQYSFEERMGCGFGACMGCTCKTKYGSKRICKDGPVLEKEEIVW